MTSEQTLQLAAEMQELADDIGASATPELRFELDVLTYAVRAFDRLIRFREACDASDTAQREALRRLAREEAAQFLEMVQTSRAPGASAYLATYWETETKIKTPFYFMFKAGDADMFSACIPVP